MTALRINWRTSIATYNGRQLPIDQLPDTEQVRRALNREHITPEARPEKLRGMGDVVHAITHGLGVDVLVEQAARRWHRLRGRRPGSDPCGCKRRRRQWNRWLPFRR